MSNIFKVVDDIFRLLSEIAMVVGAFGVFYAVKTFKKSEQDSRKQEQTELMNNSIEVLKIFSSNLIPKFSIYTEEATEKYETFIKNAIERAGGKITDVDIEDKLKKVYAIRAKQEAGGVSLLNQIEQVCAYINYDLVIEDVVFPTTYKVFLDFFDRNNDLLKLVTSEETPYKNIHSVLEEWENKAKKEKLNRKQKELDDEKANLFR